MGEITIHVAGRGYRLGCNDGEEEHLTALADLIDHEAKELSQRIRAPLSEGRLILMAALMVADRYAESEQRAADAEARAAEAEQRAAELESRAVASEARADELQGALDRGDAGSSTGSDLFAGIDEPALVERVNAMAERLESLVAAMGLDAPRPELPRARQAPRSPDPETDPDVQPDRSVRSAAGFGSDA